MKTVLRKVLFMMAVATGMLAVLTGCDDEKKIKTKDLPGAAREFITQYFPGLNVLHAEKDRDDRAVTYNVRLSDATEIEFDESG